MRKTPLKKISDKQRQKLASEQKIKAEMIKQQLDAVGYTYCMTCGQYVGNDRLMKSHVKGRSRFVMQCYACHFPNNKHKYLEEHGIEGE